MSKWEVKKREDGLFFGHLWNQVCRSEAFGDDPDDMSDFLSFVKYGDREFTAIDAYAQIRKATEIMGPFGSNWGLRNLMLNTMEHAKTTFRNGKPSTAKGFLLLAQAEFFYRYEDANMTVEGSFPIATSVWMDHISDAPKKAYTDMLTKALSYLGFNADVFFGRFDGNKYYQPEADDEMKKRLISLAKEAEKATGKPIVAVLEQNHKKRGWLKKEVLRDIKKLEDLILSSKKDETTKNKNVKKEEGE